jgi:hypothetical protein
MADFLAWVLAVLKELVPILASIAAIIAAVKSQRNGQKIDVLQTAQENTHAAINGKMDKLLVVTAAASEAKGRAEGVASEQIRASQPGMK